MNDTKAVDLKEVLLNADRDQFITPKEAKLLQARLNDLLWEARAPFTVAVTRQEFSHPLGEYVHLGDDAGEEMYNLVWGGTVIENAGIFVAYANRWGLAKQVLHSLERCSRKGLHVGWWVRGYIERSVKR